jgi:hypothetical protein
MTALGPAEINRLFLTRSCTASRSPMAMRAAERVIGLSRALGDCRVYPAMR